MALSFVGGCLKSAWQGRHRVGRILAGLCVCALLTGCAETDAPEGLPRVADAPLPPLDPLDGAPADWQPFLDWADAELSKTPASVPLPLDARLPDSKWQLVRLAERLPRADVMCKWRPPKTGSKTLVTLGPARGSGSIALSGFEVRREDVGRVTLDVRADSARHLDLIWSRGGRIRIPIPSNDRFWTLSTTTDGFAEWTGALRQITLKIEGGGEVRSVLLLSRENAFAEPVGTTRTNLDKETRDAIYVHCPAEIRFSKVKVPRGGKLHVGLGLIANRGNAEGQSHDRIPTTFEVIVEHRGETESVLSRTIGGLNEWVDVLAPLDEYSGETVALVLRATGRKASVALWGNPILYEPVKDPPIHILYLIDTLGAKHIDLYGYDRPTMPRMEKLASEGIWFSQAFSNSPRTISSIPDLMFSLPTERHGVSHASLRAPTELVSLSDSVRAAGYATASFCTNVNAGPRQNLDQGFDHFFDRIGFWWSRNDDRTVPIDDVLRWLDTHRDRPVFLYIHTAEPHAPYEAPEGFSGRFDTGYRGTIDGSYDRSTRFRNARTAEEIAHVVSLYDEECLYADARLGLFLDALRERGLWNRVQLFVTADHGEEFLEHGQWTHGSNLHDPVQRIPLVAVGSSITARGRIDAPVQLYDLMPTFLDLLDLPEPYPLAGDSLRPLLQSVTRSTNTTPDGSVKPLANRSLYASNHSYARLGVVEGVVIDAGQWKLMYRIVKNQRPARRRPTGFELYDIRSDHRETRNIIDEHRSLARDLIGKLIAYRRNQHPFDPTLHHGRLELDPDQLRELQSLGYVGEFED